MGNQKNLLLVLNYFDGLGSGGSGGAQRSEHLLKALQGVSICDVALLDVPHDMDAKQVIANLENLTQPDANFYFFHVNQGKKVPLIYRIFRYLARRLCIYPAIYIFFPAFNDKFPAVLSLINKNHYDGIIIRYFRNGTRTGLFNFSHVPILLDVDDNPLDLIETNATSLVKRSGLIKIWTFLTRKWMKSTLAKCDFTWWVRREELDRFRHCNGSVLQNVPAFSKELTTEANDNLDKQPTLNVLFVGRLKYAANANGLKWFLKSVWPQVINTEKKAILNIVGKGADHELQNMINSTDGVQYHGFQEELSSFYAKATLSICPIHQGAGSKIKILESMAYKRPIVVTPHAYEGLQESVSAGNGMLQAETADEFADIILELWHHPEVAHEIASKGFITVQNNFSLENFTKVVQEGVREVFKNGLTDHG